jgi:hypothetical protein
MRRDHEGRDVDRYLGLMSARRVQPRKVKVAVVLGPATGPAEVPICAEDDAFRSIGHHLRKYLVPLLLPVVRILLSVMSFLAGSASSLVVVAMPFAICSIPWPLFLVM